MLMQQYTAQCAMSVEAPLAPRTAPHVIVLGSEKGGSGKSAVESVIVRNRFSRPTGRRKADFLRQLASRPGFRAIDDLPEREAYEAFVPHGLTALDDAHEVASAIELESVAEMREEVRSFVETLKLPIDELQRKRAASRRMVCFTRQAD
jgi:hypothetical protein